MALSSVSAYLSWKFLPVRRSGITPPPSLYFVRSNFIPKFAYTFPRCSILSNNKSLFLDYKSIINSNLTINSCSNSSFSVCDLFDYNNHQSHYNLCRMLASSLLLLAVIVMSSLFAPHSALAASSGRMGSSSRSSLSSSSSKSTRPSRSSSSNSTRPFRSSSSYTTTYIQYRSRSSVNISDYYDKLKCSGCNSSSDVSGSLSMCDCDCKCHGPCKCKCHSPGTIPKPVGVIMCILFVITVIAEDHRKNGVSKDTNEDNVQAFDWKVEVADVRRGSVLLVQVGILDKKRELQRKLYRIAETADTYTTSGLNNVKKEVVKALLEHQDSCHFAYLFAKYDDMEKYSRPCYRGFLETELAKFDKEEETFVNVDGVRCKKESAGNASIINNEYSVVTLLVLADGEYWIPSVKGHTSHVDKADVRTALQKIRSIGRSSLEAVEVLWTPQTENDSISEQELRRDFGLLMRPVRLIKKPYSLLSWF
ncbi:hypothetical protein OROMI_005087 [Orobanche minor]